MTVRYYEDSDYATVSAWWAAHDWPIIPQDALPPLGFIVDDMCVVWLYLTGTSVSWVEWLVANPKADKRKLTKAVDSVLQAAFDESKLQGAYMIFTSTKHEGLIRRFKKHGFSVNDTSMTNLMKVV